MAKEEAAKKVDDLVKADSSGSVDAQALVKKATVEEEAKAKTNQMADALKTGDIKVKESSAAAKIRTSISDQMEKATDSATERVASHVTDPAMKLKVKQAMKDEMIKAVARTSSRVAQDVTAQMKLRTPKSDKGVADQKTNKAVDNMAVKIQMLEKKKAELEAKENDATGDALDALQKKVADVSEEQATLVETAKEVTKNADNGSPTDTDEKLKIAKASAEVKVMQKESASATKIANEKIEKGKSAEVKAKKLGEKSKAMAKKSAEEVKEMARKRVRKAQEEANQVRRAASRMTDKAQAEAQLATDKANAAVKAAQPVVPAEVITSASPGAVAIAGVKEKSASAQRQLDRAKAEKVKDKKRVEDLETKSKTASGDEKEAVNEEIARAKKALNAIRAKMARKAEKLAAINAEMAKNAVAMAKGKTEPEPSNKVEKDDSGVMTIINGEPVANPSTTKVINGKTRTVHIHIHGPRTKKKKDDDKEN